MSAVRCALPNGFTIEVGTPGEEGYQFYDLKPGTRRRPSSQNIPAEVISPWLKVNARLRYVREKLIYIEK